MRKLQTYILLIALSLFAACLTPIRGPRKALTNAKAMQPFDVVVVPGIPFNNGTWDTVMKGRVLWSWILYKNGIVKNVIYSGGAVYSPFTEAKIMGIYAQKLGIPPEHIFYDTLARHSTENVYYSYKLAKQLGFKSIALATDPFQALLLRSFTRKRFSTPVYHLPFVTDSLKVYSHLNPRINPKPALVNVDSFNSITSDEGFFRRLRGTLGKDIEWHNYPDGKLAPL